VKDGEKVRFYRDGELQISTAIKHGLYLELERYRVDGRSALGHALAKSRAALAELFPNGPDAAASILIDRIIYKSLRVELFEGFDYATAQATPGAVQYYVGLSNSLRNDLAALKEMAKAQAPASSDPDLAEYLETMKRAAKAQPVQVLKRQA